VLNECLLQQAVVEFLDSKSVQLNCLNYWKLGFLQKNEEYFLAPDYNVIGSVLVLVKNTTCTGSLQTLPLSTVSVPLSSLSTVNGVSQVTPSPAGPVGESCNLRLVISSLQASFVDGFVVLSL